MTKAQPVHAGESLFLTRRIRNQTFLLRPSKKLNNLIRYVVAVKSAELGVPIHAICVMSNHWHKCITDPLAHVVSFQRDCHTFIARALNAMHGEFESIWSSAPPSRVTCEEPESLLQKIAYTMANPVEAGLVRHGKSWPGIRHAWPHPPIKIARPKEFFRGEADGGNWPEFATLTFTRPPGFENISNEELAQKIAHAIKAAEDHSRHKRREKGQTFLGRKRVCEQSRHHRPSGRAPRFQLSPRHACRDLSLRIERLRARKAWLHDYEAARDLWFAGQRGILFPPGTYKMRVVHNALCRDVST